MLAVKGLTKSLELMESWHFIQFPEITSFLSLLRLDTGLSSPTNLSMNNLEIPVERTLDYFSHGHLFLSSP